MAGKRNRFDEEVAREEAPFESDLTNDRPTMFRQLDVSEVPPLPSDYDRVTHPQMEQAPLRSLDEAFPASQYAGGERVIPRRGGRARRSGGAAAGGRQRAPRPQHIPDPNSIAEKIAVGAKRAAVAVVNARLAGKKLKLSEACKDFGGGADFSGLRRDLQSQRDVAKLQYQCLKAELRKMGVGNHKVKPEERFIRLKMKAMGANNQAAQIATDEGFGAEKVEMLTATARQRRTTAQANARARRPMRS